MQTSSENPYQVSKAELPETRPEVSGEEFYYAVSLRKFCLLSFFSFGLYLLYWFYRQWQYYGKISGENISPAWRTILGLFWIHSCLKKIHQAGVEAELEPDFSPGFYASVFILMNFATRLPGALGYIGFFSFVPLALVNQEIIRMNQKLRPDYRPDDRFGAGAIAILLIGGLMALLMVSGMVLPSDS